MLKCPVQDKLLPTTRHAEQYRLSSTTTVQRYRELELKGDRAALAEFVRLRFDERYFMPMERSDRNRKHGFAQMAVGCIVIETLEAFYQGRTDSRNMSTQLFRDFFQRDTPLSCFGDADDWFYKNVRCGILHQGEVRDGWRIVRKGKLFDRSSRCINATAFLRSLKRAVDHYAGQLVTDDALWLLFKKKMKAICQNCAEQA